MSDLYRITHRSNTGTYVFEVVPEVEGYRVSMHYFQDYPKDEAIEQTRVIEEYYKEYSKALAYMYSLYKQEKGKEFPGYNLTKDQNNVVRVRNYTGYIEEDLTMNIEEPYQCNYYDSSEDKDGDYYDNTSVYDSVADAMIEAANTVTEVEENTGREIDVRIMELPEE